MNKLTIIKGRDKYNIFIDSYKIICGHNYNMKFDMIRTIKRFSQNIKPSEYATDNYNFTKIFVDDQNINAKDVLMYHVDKNYSLVDDFKLTSKSLMNKYFEILLSNNQFIETINTINILYESLSHEMSLSSFITGHFSSMVPKQLIKLMTPIYILDGYSKDEYDMNYEDIIIFQLQLIKYIVEHNETYKYIIICVEISYLTEKIYELIEELKYCFVLVFVEHKTFICKDIFKYILCEKKYLDNADEETFYEIICDNNFQLLTLKEGREYMEKFLLNKEQQSMRSIMKILNM